MVEVPTGNEDSRQIRTKKFVAARGALYDQELTERTKAVRGDVRYIVEAVCNSLALAKRDVPCDEIRELIRRRIGKKPKAKMAGRQALNEYRRVAGEWVDGDTIYDYPPNLRLQGLGELTDSNFEDYFQYFMEVLEDYDRRVEPIDEMIRDSLQGSDGELILAEDRTSKLAVNPEIVAARDKILGSESFKYQVSYPFMNLQKAFIEYAGKDERRALRVFVRLLQQRAELVLRFSGLVEAVFRKLSGNEYFLRSFFNLVDEGFNRKSSDLGVDELTLGEFLRAADKIGVCQVDYDTALPAIQSLDEPRDHNDYVVVVTCEGAVPGKISGAMVIKTPARFLPLSWNSHRLVDPTRNRQMRALAGNLDSVDAEELVPGDDVQKYEDGLKTGRRYYTNFARMAVTDMPGFSEEDEIYLHFFNRPGKMSPLELGVEVIVNGASIVYFLNEDCGLEMRSYGNVIPCDEQLGGFLEREPGAKEFVDAIFGKTAVTRWASPDVQEKLRRIALKYAYYLLVERRSGMKAGGTLKKPKAKTPFDLLLEGRDSEVEIPATGGKGGGESGEAGVTRRLLIRHDVDGFTRELPEGQRHSLEAEERALEEAGITLRSGQTYVRRHKRGTVVAGDSSTKATKVLRV